MKVLVIKGGFSRERDVSLSTGRSFEQALAKLKYPFWSHDLTKDNVWELKDLIKKYNPDVVLNALHGPFGEDGGLQTLLDLCGVPYVESGPVASCLGIDKLRSRVIFESSGIPVPDTKIVSWPLHEPYPFVIKPHNDGSSMGVFIIENDQDLKYAEKNWSFGDTFLLEPYLKGKEIQVGILDNQVLGAVEVKPKSRFFDYYAKYTQGASDDLAPAPLTSAQEETLFDYALRAHKALGCKGLTRSDFILCDDVFYLLEINTLPGMTPTSLIPLIVKNIHGWSFEELLERMLHSAIGAQQHAHMQSL